MASSLSGQDEMNPALWLTTWAGKMELSCPLRSKRCVLQEIFPCKLYNKSLIDQACSVKMAGCCPSLSVCVYRLRLNSVSIHKHAEKEFGQYQAILTEQAGSVTHIYSWVCFSFLWCYGWTCLLIEFIHKVTSLLRVWRMMLQVTQNVMTALSSKL